MANSLYSQFSTTSHETLTEVIAGFTNPAISRNRVNPNIPREEIRAKLTVLARQPVTCSSTQHNLIVGRNELIVVVHSQFKSEDYLDGFLMGNSASYRFVFGDNLRDCNFPQLYQDAFEIYKPTISKSLRWGNYACAIERIAEFSNDAIKLYRDLNNKHR